MSDVEQRQPLPGDPDYPETLNRLHEDIFELRGLIVREYWFPGGMQRIHPFKTNDDNYDEIEIVVSENKLLQERGRLVIYPDGEWGTSGSVNPRNDITSIVRDYMVIASEDAQASYINHTERIDGFDISYEKNEISYQELKHAYDTEFRRYADESNQYLDVNRLELTRGFKSALEDTLHRLQNPQENT